MTGITSIQRDFPNAPNIVRILSTDTIATVSAANYILNQASNIAAVNEGAFEWQSSDFVLVSASDGWGLFSIAANFNSLTPFAISTTVVGAPVTIGDFAVFQSTSGNIEDLGYLPSDASKTRVVMAGSAVVANHIALFQDTHGTIDDTAATAINNGSIQAGLSGTAGTLISFPSGATSGSLILAAVTNSGGNFNTTISNASSVGQSQVISIPDSGAATSNFVLSQSNAPTNNVTFTKVVTATAAALATAGKVNVQVHPSATSQFAVIDIKVLKSTGLSGGGGDRLLSVSDGTIVFNDAGITAALLGTPILTVWGGTGNPLAVGASEVSTAGADIFLQYIGGTTDYTLGSVQLAITLVQVTA